MFGRAHRDSVHNTLHAYERLFAETVNVTHTDMRQLGAGLAERLSDGPFADLVAEIDGIAAGAGVNAHALLAVNARTEILAGHGGPECTVVGATSMPIRRGQCILGQNWDFHPALSESRIVWSVLLPTGAWFTTFTEAGLVGKIGLSSHRIGLAINMLRSEDDGGVYGVPIHMLLRHVLERSTNLAEALAILGRATVSASVSVVVAFCSDDSSALASVEISPNGLAITWPDERGIVVHTNHFLANGPATDAGAWEWPSTFVRFFEAERHLRAEECTTRSVLEAVLTSHFDAPDGICCHRTNEHTWRDRCATLASIIMDVANLELRISDGHPCTSAYETVAPPILTR